MASIPNITIDADIDTKKLEAQLDIVSQYLHHVADATTSLADGLRRISYTFDKEPKK